MTTVPVPHPLIVHVTGGGTSLTTILIIIAGALATVTASMVSARIVSRTTTQTLNARVAFERGETDRAELRSILDRIATQMLAVDQTLQRAAVAARDAVAEKDDDARRIFYRRLFEGYKETIIEAIQVANDETQRLRLRLGEEGRNLGGPASTLIQTGGTAWTLLLEFDFTPEKAAAIEAASGTVAASRETFVDTALEFTRAELYRPPEPEPQRVAFFSRRRRAG